jgi:hypothetical protein
MEVRSVLRRLVLGAPQQANEGLDPFPSEARDEELAARRQREAGGNLPLLEHEHVGTDREPLPQEPVAFEGNRSDVEELVRTRPQWESLERHRRVDL